MGAKEGRLAGGDLVHPTGCGYLPFVEIRPWWAEVQIRRSGCCSILHLALVLDNVLGPKWVPRDDSGASRS